MSSVQIVCLLNTSDAHITLLKICVYIMYMCMLYVNITCYNTPHACVHVSHCICCTVDPSRIFCAQFESGMSWVKFKPSVILVCFITPFAPAGKVLLLSRQSSGDMAEGVQYRVRHTTKTDVCMCCSKSCLQCTAYIHVSITTW